jgi:hypothetical protein
MVQKPRKRGTHPQKPTSPVSEAVSSRALDEVLTEIKTALQKIHLLIERLQPKERLVLHDNLRSLVAQEVPRWFVATAGYESSEQEAKTISQAYATIGLHCSQENSETLRQIIEDVGQKVRKRYAVKPQMTARDAEVERLRDQKKLDWKEILKMVRNKPEWAISRGGKPVTLGALRTAYCRRKKVQVK